MAVDAWKNFELSGKVSDYLAYRQGTDAKNTQKYGGPKEAGKAVFLGKGMSTYGTERGSCGDGAAGDADWGV